MDDRPYDPFCDGQKRTESRLRLRLAAKVITKVAEHQIVLINLSHFGARVEGVDISAKTGEILLEWFGYEAFGQVAWANGTSLGMRFFDPIPDPWLIRSRELDMIHHLPPDRDLARLAARNWVAGMSPR